MKNMRTFGLTFHLLTFFAVVANAQDYKTMIKNERELNKMVRYGITLDQDMFVETLGLRGKNEDRNYTMGIGLFLSNNWWADAVVFGPLKKLSLKTFKQSERSDETVLLRNVTANLGMTGFTPRYLRDNIADSLYYIQNDRPFSSLTFLSLKYQIGSKTKVVTNQFVIGILGLGIGREVQTIIHRNHWFGSIRDIPTGWKYQVSNGGEPTFLVSNRMDKLLNENSFNENRYNNINTQFIFSREYRLGYYTGANAGLTMRLGILDPFNWSSYDTYQLGFASAITPDENKRKLTGELYFQLSIRPHIVLYNAHLMGQFKKNFHDFSFSEIEYFVVEGFTGIGITLPNAKKSFGINLLVYLSGRTPEFKTSLSNRSHIWGGFQLSFIRIKP